MFADDILIFSKGNLKFVSAIMEALNDFNSWSGLAMNIGKSAVFFGGTNERIIEQILELMVSNLRSFPLNTLSSHWMARLREGPLMRFLLR